jgi:hypothetical protein
MPWEMVSFCAARRLLKIKTMTTRILAFTLVVLASTIAAASAQTTGLEPGHGLVWGAVGFQADTGGSLNTSGVGNIGGARAEIDENTWGERYDAALEFRLGYAYNVTNRTQGFFALHWEQAEADETGVGLLGGQPLNAKFSDLQGWAFDVGIRRFFPTTVKAKPFVAASVGFLHLPKIDVDFSSTTNNFSATDVPFYDNSWVAQWRLGTGVLWDITPRIGWQATVDLKYSGKLSDRSGLGTLGLERVNNAGNRWSLPILGGVYYKF